MQHPIFVVRSAVAKSLGTHAFDPMIMDMPPEQLFILFYQSQERLKQEEERMLEWVKAINQVWERNLSHLFDEVKLFINPDMFKRLIEIRNTKVHREEINEDNFNEIWTNIKRSIPEHYEEVVEQVYEQTLPDLDDNTERLLAGWVPYIPSKERRGT